MPTKVTPLAATTKVTTAGTRVSGPVSAVLSEPASVPSSATPPPR